MTRRPVDRPDLRELLAQVHASGADESALHEQLADCIYELAVHARARIRWLIRLVTKPGDVVLDPFGGSGTTGVAALLEGRRVILVEQDPRFAAIARARCVFAASPEGALRLESRRKPRPRNRACSVQVSAAVAMNPLSTHPHGPLFARCEASR